MESPNQIRVFSSFKPFLQLLQSYNTENYKKCRRAQLVKNIGLAFGMTVLIALLPISIVLIIWCLIDKNVTLQKVVVIAPLILTIFQLFVKICSLVTKNRHVNETIARLQGVIDQRKYLYATSFTFYCSSRKQKLLSCECRLA